MESKRVFFIGNRTPVFKKLLETQWLELAFVVAQENSFLHDYLRAAGIEHEIVSQRNRSAIIDKIRSTEFDLLISNGCPIILPITELQSSGQLYVNIHPSLLPDLKGKHPVNGALMKRRPSAGATMHFMDDGIDTGNIVYQESFPLTDDIDLGLLYQLLFDLELRVFERGMEILCDTGFCFAGEPQIGIGDYYSRNGADMIVDFTEMPKDEFLTRVRAFGIRSQGVTCRLEGILITVIEAMQITNSYVLDRYRNEVPGTVLLKYEDTALVKAADGIVKVRILDTSCNM